MKNEKPVSELTRKRFSYITNMCDYFIEMFKEFPEKLKQHDSEAYDIIKDAELQNGQRHSIHKLHIAMALKYY